jgi:hypothetical protein
MDCSCAELAPHAGAPAENPLLYQDQKNLTQHKEQRASPKFKTILPHRSRKQKAKFSPAVPHKVL